MAAFKIVRVFVVLAFLSLASVAFSNNLNVPNKAENNNLNSAKQGELGVKSNQSSTKQAVSFNQSNQNSANKSISSDSQIEVSAKHFYADEKKGENVLSGDVFIKRGNDTLRSNKLIINTSPTRKALKYTATGDARFEITLNDKFYKGRADEIIYFVGADSYEIRGNAQIEELSTNKKLIGERITIDRKRGVYQVSSNEQKPVKFVFELDESLEGK